MTNTPATCAQCRSPLPAGRLDGLCPKCLLRHGLEVDPTSLPPTESPGSQTSQASSRLFRFTVPTAAKVAPHFPQLEILELLGVGGMGAVYKARQHSLDRYVALKILPREVGADPAFAERFAREARALARLNHANIVTVHDIGQVDGLYYILMEHVDGLNLRQLMTSGELNPEQAIGLVPQLCEALQYAHDEGIVHRDIKPENILINKRGRAKIADFGLAKMLGDRVLDTSLTGTEQVMGTLRYMAPEQMMGARDVDHRADIYALGVVFYELLTGDLPLGRFPLPSQKAGVDARLDEVVLKALEREPQRRYQQAGEIKTDVEEITSTKGGARAPSKTTSPTRAPWKTLSHDEFEQAADEVRPAATGLMAVSILQLLVMLGAMITGGVWWFMPIQDRMYNRSPFGFDFFETVLVLAHLPLALLLLPAALSMRRMRSYEFALIASLVAMLPLGFSCVLTLPVGLWCLLVLMRPNVRAAFRMRSKDRPAAWQNRDAEILREESPESPAYQESLQRVEARCRTAGIWLLITAGFDVAACAVLAGVLLTESRGMPTWVFIAMVCIPLLTSVAIAAGGVCLICRRFWGLAVFACVLTLLPLSFLWWIRWIVGLGVLIQLLRRDVRLAFERRTVSGLSPQPPVKEVLRSPVYAPPSSVSLPRVDE